MNRYFYRSIMGSALLLLLARTILDVWYFQKIRDFSSFTIRNTYQDRSAYITFFTIILVFVVGLIILVKRNEFASPRLVALYALSTLLVGMIELVVFIVYFQPTPVQNIPIFWIPITLMLILPIIAEYLESNRIFHTSLVFVPLSLLLFQLVVFLNLDQEIEVGVELTVYGLFIFSISNLLDKLQSLSN